MSGGEPPLRPHLRRMDSSRCVVMRVVMQSGRNLDSSFCCPGTAYRGGGRNRKARIWRAWGSQPVTREARPMVSTALAA